MQAESLAGIKSDLCVNAYPFSIGFRALQYCTELVGCIVALISLYSAQKKGLYMSVSFFRGIIATRTQ